MPAAKNLTAYQDLRELLQQAVEAPKGIAVDCPTKAAAINLRSRLYSARKAECRENLKRYPEGHVPHGSSHFDSLQIRVVERPEGPAVEIINTPAIEFNIRRL